MIAFVVGFVVVFTLFTAAPLLLTRGERGYDDIP